MMGKIKVSLNKQVFMINNLFFCAFRIKCQRNVACICVFVVVVSVDAFSLIYLFTFRYKHHVVVMCIFCK